MADQGKKLSDHERQRIEQLRRQGVSVRETARRLGVCPSTVQRADKKSAAK